MAFGLTPAGTITKENLKLSTRRLPVAATTNIAKGDVCEIDGSGNVIISPVDSVAGNFFVALAAADNSAGAAGDISVPLAVRGHFVTVVADDAINPGERVKLSATDNGTVVPFLETTDSEEKLVGVYWGKEGGIVVKSTTDADGYAETFTDDADFVPVAAADGDIVEIELK
jgi:hypothetical protein